MPAGLTVADVVAILDRLYEPSTAEEWDAVGLVCGNPTNPVSKVLFAVDPAAAVVEEAIAWGADLVVTHHPVFLRPVHGVAATSARGRLVHTLIRHDVALHCAHTNADAADPGVSDALAQRIGLVDLAPLSARPTEPSDKLITFVPWGALDRVIDALAAVGAGVIGDYERCAWTTEGEGTFRPLPGARPTTGQVGEVERVPEHRLEMVVPRHRRADSIAALRRAHPYEEPAFDVVELAALPGRTGIGRVGRLPDPMRLTDFTVLVASSLPATVVGVRAAGDPDMVVESVAVCGGAGDSLLSAAQRGRADAYVTGDLRHHPVSDHLAEGGPAVVDVTHWASEWPWLSDAARSLTAEAAAAGATVDTRVSTIPTDPWSLHQPSRSSR
ncbi:MAG: Nif3-like dinuclear metal center hexameric protein [Candidatus Nanopelagicales bacterium]